MAAGQKSLATTEKPARDSLTQTSLGAYVQGKVRLALFDVSENSVSVDVGRTLGQIGSAVVFLALVTFDGSSEKVFPGA